MDIVEGMNTIIQERHNCSEKCITVKMSRRMQKMTFTLQMKSLVLHFLIKNWDTFPEIILALIMQ